MGLNESKGNMYEWVTHTWNTVKGACPHDCSYCYMKRWGKLNPVRFDEKELNADLGEGNFIFVGSSCDMWANDIPRGWVEETLEHCRKFDNNYLFQTKNPIAFIEYAPYLMSWPYPKLSLCTTIETNRWYSEIMRNAPKPSERMGVMESITWAKRYVTIEPIMDFDLYEMFEYIWKCKPMQVNIGADSGNNNLPEPGSQKIKKLVKELERFTRVKQKKNLQRLL